MARASLMTLTGETIDAARALDYGLVTEVVPGDRLIGRAMEVAGQIAANPGHATRLAKRLLREGQDMKLAPLLELSAAFQALAHHTQDHPEAVAAFIEKREPRSEEHTSELQSLMRISYAVFCLQKKTNKNHTQKTPN